MSSYKRIVVKAGTNLLTGGTDSLDMEVMACLADQIAELRHQGREMILVTSGAVAAGRQSLSTGKNGRDIAFRQVLAAVGQSRLMHAYEQLFSRHSIPVAQALLTRRDISDRLGYLNARNTLLALLELGVVPIVNENDVVAVEELGANAVFGDNDTLSAMAANMVDADLLALLTDIGGLYTADPHRDPSARLIPRVERIDQAIEALAGAAGSHHGIGGMVTKLEAAKLATASGVAVAIADGREQGVLLRLAAGESVGTLFPPLASKMESRKRWLLSGLSASRGEIVVDAGAARALRSQHRSLLPAGVVEVRGDFQRGDTVYILEPSGARIACGIANYGSRDLAALRGLHSERIQEALGYEFGEEAVHRNNMALL